MVSSLDPTVKSYGICLPVRLLSLSPVPSRSLMWWQTVSFVSMAEGHPLCVDHLLYPVVQRRHPAGLHVLHVGTPFTACPIGPRCFAKAVQCLENVPIGVALSEHCVSPRGAATSLASPHGRAFSVLCAQGTEGAAPGEAAEHCVTLAPLGTFPKFASFLGLPPRDSSAPGVRLTLDGSTIAAPPSSVTRRLLSAPLTPLPLPSTHSHPWYLIF